MEAKFFDNGEIFSETLTISTQKFPTSIEKKLDHMNVLLLFFKKEMRLSNFISISS